MFSFSSASVIVLVLIVGSPIINGFPWGARSASTSDPYSGGADTGVTRSYDFTIARGTLSPDGYQKDMLLVNGQYPGVCIVLIQQAQPLIAQSLAFDRSELGRHDSSHRE